MTALARRLLGGLLLAFSFAPIYRLLDAEDDALRRASVDVAGSTLALVQTGTLTALLLGVLFAFLVPRARVLPVLASLGAHVSAVPPARWAVTAGAVAFGLASTANVLLFRGLYTNIDEISSFIQARYLAAGRLAGPLPAGAEGWLIPNMLTVDAGWVSQFPPSHLVALAGGEWLGMPTLVGPIFFGLLAAMTTLCLARLLPDHGVVARLAGALVALSPFLLFLGAGGWSHVTAGAFLWLALYAALRARDGHETWALAAGAAIGLAVCSRPWISVVLGTIATLGVWLPTRPAPRWFVRRSLWTAAGGAPFALALGAYNRTLFGSPTTLGYLAAFGERHRLGFHQDPWGNAYTPLDALALTSGDVIVFGAQLLETPIPLGALIGAWLLLSRRLPSGAGVLVAWALVPIAANALYWFHSTRMMYEAAPAWLALAALAVVPLLGERGADTTAVRPARRIEPASVGLWTVGAALGMAVVLGAPQRLASFAWDDDTLARLTVPAAPDGRAALVFVHASWNERLSARLQGAGGMRQDSVISLLRRNTNCELETYARARSARAGNAATGAGGDPLPEIDLRQLPGTPDDIVRPPVPDGTTLRTRQGERFPPWCQRELSADRLGAVALAPLLWQGDLPGIESGAPLFVRDLGPEWNGTLLERYPDRTPWVFVPRAPDAPPELVPYEEAVRVLWGATLPADSAGAAPPAP